MKGFASDSSNDLMIKNGRFLTVSGAEYVLQKVRARLLFYLGEWFLDRSVGVPYLQDIFTKPASLGNVESILKETIIRTRGVERLLQFSMEFDEVTRKLSVNFSAETIYGSIDNRKVTINV